MIIGILIGSLIGIAVALFVVNFDERSWRWDGWQKTLFGIVIILILAIICGGVGMLVDRCNQAEYIAIWDVTRTSYEQAMNVYDNYESMVKDNPDLLKDVIAKNEELAHMKHQATRWWNWHLDDNIANLQPIKIGTN